MPDINLSDDELIQLAGTRSFDRGLEYARKGRVALKTHNERLLAGVVRGSMRYHVRIAASADNPEPSCDCPAAAEEEWCKHAVALAIAARDARSDMPADALGAFLAQQPAERLAQWLLEFAHEHTDIHRTLELRRAHAAPAQLRKALQQMLRAGDLLDWKQSIQFARRVDTAIGAVTELLQRSDNEAFWCLEMMLTRLMKIYERADDSSGAIGERIRQVAELYIEAISPVHAASAVFGATLLKLKMQDSWGFLPLGALWALLSAAAQNRYANLLAKQASAIPEKSPPSGEHWQTAHLYQELCEVRGDLDSLIAFLARDLRAAHRFERIARLCMDAGRVREAVQWLERGHRKFPDSDGLMRALAAANEQEGFTDEALRLYARCFEVRPGLDSWDDLKRAARGEWPTHRKWALDFVTSRERTSARGERDASGRIQLLLHDEDIEGAIALAGMYQASQGVLMQLAKAAAETDPTNAAQFMRRAIDADLVHASSPRYAAIVNDMKRCKQLDPTAATAWMREIRTRYKARRKLMQLMEQSGL